MMFIQYMTKFIYVYESYNNLYQINLNYNFQVRYNSFTPMQQGTTVIVQLFSSRFNRFSLYKEFYRKLIFHLRFEQLYLYYKMNR